MRTWFLKWLAQDYAISLECDFDNRVDQRVAQIMSQQDPLEPLLKLFNGVFDEKREQPEDGLSEPDRIAMEMFGYRNHKDPHFHFLMDWIVNTYASAMLKKPLGTSEQIVHGHMYARALLSVSLLLKDKMGRLSSLYEQRLRGDTLFDKHTAVE
jgi:hypothetical protein